jgi:hypothetical protein
MSTLVNAPGLSQLAYRVRTYTDSFAGMQQNLGTFVIPGSSPPLRPLAALTTRAPDDPTIALLDAWAIVIDVLAFYQERIANEGYLRTATEFVSLIELAAAVGYELNPGVAAAAYLAFVVTDAPGAPSQANVPVGTRVQSVPGQNQLPQVFETTHAITARAAWNALGPSLTQPQQLASGPSRAQHPPQVSQLTLASVSYNLQPGALLWVGQQNKVVHVQKAVVNPVAGTTTIQLVETVRLVPSQQQSSPAPVTPGLQLSLTSAHVKQWILGHSWTASTLDAFLAQVGWDRDVVSNMVASLMAVPSQPQLLQAFQQQAGFSPGSTTPTTWKTTVTVASTTETDYQITPSEPPAPTQIWQPDPSDGWYVLLDRVVPGIVPDTSGASTGGVNSGVLLVDTTGQTNPAFYRVSSVRPYMADGAQVTRLSFDLDGVDTANLPSFYVGSTIAYVQSQDLALAPTVPCQGPLTQGTTVLLDQMVIGLEPNQLVAITGKVVTADTPPKTLDVTQTEVLQLSSVTHDGGYTTLTFEGSLQNTYDATTVTISANVAPVTHGQTTVNEVLGSGDGSQQNQAFVLSKPSLTHVQAPTATGGVTTLAVSVNGVPWQEVPTLYDQLGQSRVYMTRTDDQARTSVIFGDGQQGARLPTGQENVTATYRTGLGPAGNVAAGALMLLFSPPLGVRSVSNPLPAAGGVAPEALEDARADAPRAVRTLGRIVTLSDFEDFAADYPGVGKAQVTALDRDGDPLAHLTVSAPDGSPLDLTDLTNLSNAIAANVDPIQLFAVDPCTTVYFAVTATLTFAAGADPSTVKAAAWTALQAEFGNAARSFGQSVRAVEVIVTLQRVPGVRGVQLQELYPIGQSVGTLLPTVLTAAPAGFSPIGTTIGAELLLISTSTTDVTLHP